MMMSSNSRAGSRRGAGLRALFSAVVAFSPCAGARAQQLDEIIVTADRAAPDPTTIDADARSLLGAPGDVNDPLRALLSLPGITFGGGDLDPPVIRGGGPDDNLFLIDGVPVADVFHELSDSVVSPNVIRTFDLHAAAFDPAYGDAVGGVIDIGLRDPGADETVLRLDLSQLKAGVLFEAPVSDRSSFYASYRHNLAHLFLEDFERGDDILVFQMPESRDYAFRYQWRGEGYDLSLTALGAWDETEERQNEDIAGPVVFGETQTRRFDSQALRFRRDVGATGRLSATASYTDNSDETEFVNGDFSELDVETIALRASYEQRIGRRVLRIGTNIRRDEGRLAFKGVSPLCDFFETRCAAAFAPVPVVSEQSFTVSEAYADGAVSVTDRLSVDLGAHAAYDHFLDEGFIEPRLGASYTVGERFAAYARLGAHRRRPGLDRLLLLGEAAGVQENETSRQALVGQRWDISDAWRLQTEAWYKDFTIRDLAGTPIALDIEGEAYGVEVLLAKPMSERLYGWLAFSYSESKRTRLDTDRTFDDRFSAPLSATVALNYAFGNGWRIGAKWRGQSGAVFTPLRGARLDPVTERPILSFGDPFSERLRAYHRLDLRVEKQARHGFGDVLYYVDVLNVTDRENAANRDFPLRNAMRGPDGALDIAPDDEEGIPFFVAVGVNLSF